LKSNRRRLHG